MEIPYTKYIESVHNPLVREWVSIKEKSRSRRRTGMFLAEGLREIRLAVEGGYKISQLIVHEGFIQDQEVHDTIHFIRERQPNPQTAQQRIIKVSRLVYERLAHRTGTEGMLMVAQAREHRLSDLRFIRDSPLILVSEAPEKPGNLGALLRTADAANVDAVIVVNATSDLYNPNSVRSSVGCLFTNQIAVAKTEEAIQFLRSKGVTIYAASLLDARRYDTVDFTVPCAIVVGSEHKGLSKTWLVEADASICIPMQGRIDSLNVSVSAGILIFEAKRQRNFM